MLCSLRLNFLEGLFKLTGLYLMDIPVHENLLNVTNLSL